MVLIFYCFINYKVSVFFFLEHTYVIQINLFFLFNLFIPAYNEKIFLRTLNWVRHDSVRFILTIFLAVLPDFLLKYIQIITNLFDCISSEGNLRRELHENKISV